MSAAATTRGVATARMLGWAGWPDTDEARTALRRVRRGVEIAHELTADAIEHGPGSGRDPGGLSRGEAADLEWCGAFVGFLKLMEGFLKLMEVVS